MREMPDVHNHRSDHNMKHNEERQRYERESPGNNEHHDDVHAKGKKRIHLSVNVKERVQRHRGKVREERRVMSDIRRIEELLAEAEVLREEDFAQVMDRARGKVHHADCREVPKDAFEHIDDHKGRKKDSEEQAVILENVFWQ